MVLTPLGAIPLGVKISWPYWPSDGVSYVLHDGENLFGFDFEVVLW